MTFRQNKLIFFSLGAVSNHRKFAFCSGVNALAKIYSLCLPIVSGAALEVAQLDAIGDMC